MIELRQTPVNQPQSSVFMINHNIVRLHIPVHDPHTVTVVQSPQQLVKIKPAKNILYLNVRCGVRPDVVVGECLIELFEVGVVDVLEDESWSPADGILHHSMESDHVRASSQVLQNFYFTFYLLFLDRFQCLHHALLVGVVAHVDGLEDLGVFAPAKLPHQLIVVLVAPLHHMSLVVPVFPGSV